MAFAEDLVALVRQAGVASGATILISSAAAIPSSGMVLSVIETGGSGPLRTHNSVIRPAYIRPTVQILARAATYPAARALASGAYWAVVGVRNQTVSGGSYYREINPLQEPFDAGLDGSGRSQVAFNVIAIKRP